MATTTDAPLAAAERLAHAYGDAWNAHDIETIMSLHAPGMTFHLHVEGFEEAATPEAVRGQFEAIFAAWPDLHFATTRLHVAPELVVHEFTINGTLAAPWPIEGGAAQPTGRRIAFDGVDVLPLRDGLVARKDTYLDGLAYRAGLLEG